MWIVCITSVRHVLTVNGYGGRQTKENEKSWCFKGWETLVNNYGTEDFYKGKVPRQIDIIKSQRAVIEKLQRQIDRMQDQMEEYQHQFSKAQQIKEQLMQMLLDDRDMLRNRFINEDSTNNSTHKKK